ncbi:MAG: addiction module protein [Planctomycetaceae bacterium]|nr:addiction module protein [Planctomycetaceae bacterium]
MSTADKLQAMEEIWEDLLREPDKIPSPSWHGDVLRAREKRVKQGASRYLDWTEAKEIIRKRTRCK